MKRLIVDLDDTICYTKDGHYHSSLPNTKLIDKLRDYKSKGFEIVISTSRNMRTHNGNLGKINKFTLPVAIEWLDKFNVPYDEIYMAKPWCGFEGFYIDDKAIRPKEFVNMTYDEIMKILKEQK